MNLLENNIKTKMSTLAGKSFFNSDMNEKSFEVLVICNLDHLLM